MMATFDEAAVKHMVDRFLTWKFPTTISPDGGLSFDPIANKGTQYERRREPVGTNLLSATEATQMVLHMLEGLDLVRDADPLPDADGWEPKVGDRVKLVKDGLSTVGAVGMEGVIKKIEDCLYPYLIELDEGLVYKSHAVPYQYRLTRADRDCFVSIVRPAPSGPVVEETVKRIVPGKHGIVEVMLMYLDRETRVFISITGDNIKKFRLCTKAELFAAAETLRQIGEAMEGK